MKAKKINKNKVYLKEGSHIDWVESALVKEETGLLKIFSDKNWEKRKKLNLVI